MGNMLIVTRSGTGSRPYRINRLDPTGCFQAEIHSIVGAPPCGCPSIMQQGQVAACPYEITLLAPLTRAAPTLSLEGEGLYTIYPLH